VEGCQWSVDLKTTLYYHLSTFEGMTDGGNHEETEKNESSKGSLEEKRCQALLAKVKRRKKVSNLIIKFRRLRSEVGDKNIVKCRRNGALSFIEGEFI
jgi:hypothetical protein